MYSGINYRCVALTKSVLAMIMKWQSQKGIPTTKTEEETNM